MTTSLPTAYTPLETLLLFQALRSEGVNSYSIFNRISDQLKSIPLIHTHPNYDSGRLSPDALRELYLWLLKDEVKSDLERQLQRDNLLQNGDASPGSRKRKAPSPSLPTVHEASQHAHLIPQLVTRLYARYREHTIREIREQERRYEALSREIEEIEAGKWDERLQRQRTASTQSPRPSSSAHPQSAATRATRASTASPIPGQRPVERSATKPYTQNKIDSLINHENETQNGTSSHRRNSSNTTLPPLSEMAPHSPHLGIPPSIPSAASNHAQTYAYSLSSANAQPSPYAFHHAHPGSRPSSSPRPILPPVPGMQMPSQSPVQHTGSPGIPGPQMSQQQYAPSHRLSTGPSPTNERPPMAYASQTPVPPLYQQQPYLERRTSYPPPVQQYQSSQVGAYPTASFATEPYGSANGRNSQSFMHQHQVPQQVPSQRPPSYPQFSATAPSTTARPARPPNPRLVTDIIAALATPPRAQRRPVWKSEKQLTPIRVGTPVPRPDVEPLSPVLKRSEQPNRATRATRNRAGTHSEQPEELEALPMPTRTRGRQKRDRSPHSNVSSTADESARMTRSQSVSSTLVGVPTASDGRPGSRGNVKIEPSTPAGFVDDVDTPNEVPSGGRMTRKRRGTLQSLQQPAAKRKREHSGEEAEYEDLATPPPRPTTVLATRNFHKLSSTIMNDINSHKHASYFVNMVRDKDAPGYSEIIKQPQHLKAIRAAISAGTKAVNAAAANLESPGTPTAASSKAIAEGSATIELERSEDLIPPKAIVNAAQLEREVMRMFANAVMFNPGEDGMVKDTREMFEDIDARMQEWRGAEKEAVENEVEDEGKVKRRKL